MKKNAVNGKNFQFSEEEQKAFEIVKNITEDDLLDCWDYGEKEFKAIQIILNLIEKQREEIEEQKQNWKELLHEYGLKCEELNNSISKDKIREKIKEVSNGIYDAEGILKKLLEEN